jgi:prevent-host-death family protein
MTRNVGAAEAKRKFSELVNRVQYRGDRIVIQKRGKPAAALVGLDDLSALSKKPVAETDGDKRGSILECVGLFADFPEWGQIMKEVVASRRRSRPRKVRID